MQQQRPQPPQWVITIGGIGFLLILIVEIVSFVHLVKLGAQDPIYTYGNAIGTDFFGLTLWGTPLALPVPFPRSWWGRALLLGIPWLLAFLVVSINLRILWSV